MRPQEFVTKATSVQVDRAYPNLTSLPAVFTQLIPQLHSPLQAMLQASPGHAPRVTIVRSARLILGLVLRVSISQKLARVHVFRVKRLTTVQIQAWLHQDRSVMKATCASQVQRSANQTTTFKDDFARKETIVQLVQNTRVLVEPSLLSKV